MMFKIAIFISICTVALASHQKEHHDHHHHAKPYHFGYDIKDHHGSHYRKEQGDGHGHVQGSYGFTDARGIHREVHYVADHNGYRATVKTNEPGTASQDPADVKLHSSAKHDLHQDHGHHHQAHHQTHDQGLHQVQQHGHHAQNLQGHHHQQHNIHGVHHQGHHQVNPHVHHQAYNHGHNHHGHHHGGH